MIERGANLYHTLVLWIFMWGITRFLIAAMRMPPQPKTKRRFSEDATDTEWKA